MVGSVTSKVTGVSIWAPANQEMVGVLATSAPQKPSAEGGHTSTLSAAVAAPCLERQETVDSCDLKAGERRGPRGFVVSPWQEEEAEEAEDGGDSTLPRL